MQDAVSVLTWTWVLEEVKQLEAIDSQRPVIDGTRQFTSACKQSFGTIEALLRRLLTHRMHYIRYILPFRPSFRDRQILEGYQPNAQQDVINRLILDQKLKDLTASGKLFLDDRLEFCMKMMVADPAAKYDRDGMPSFDYAVLFAILDELLAESEKKGKKEIAEQIDELLFDALSGFAALY